MPERLDKYLIKAFPQTSRNFWKKHLADFILVNGKKPTKGQVLKGGERIQLRKELPSPHPKLLPNPKLPLNILFEDKDLIAVDKPASIPCHPLDPEETETVANAIIARYPELKRFKEHPFEAGLIHRLDNETSGVLLFARHKKSYDALARLNKSGNITKYYLALTEGIPPARGMIDVPIAHHPKNKAKMVVIRDPTEAKKLKARPAITEYRMMKKGKESCLLLVRIHKGARHQIRIHFADIGYPIMGDKLYGTRGGRAPTRHLLHARKVEFLHPLSRKKISITSPLPGDFLEALRQEIPKSIRD